MLVFIRMLQIFLGKAIAVCVGLLQNIFILVGEPFHVGTIVVNGGKLGTEEFFSVIGGFLGESVIFGVFTEIATVISEDMLTVGGNVLSLKINILGALKILDVAIRAHMTLFLGNTSFVGITIGIFHNHFSSIYIGKSCASFYRGVSINCAAATASVKITTE